MGKRSIKNRVVEGTIGVINQAAGGASGGTYEAHGWIRGAAGLDFPVTDEMTASRRSHTKRLVGQVALLNLGKGQPLVDCVSPERHLVSDKCVTRTKNGKTPYAQINVTMAVEPTRRLLESGQDVILRYVVGDVATIEDGQDEIPMATNLVMRRASLKAILEAQGEEAYVMGERGDRFAFCRNDRGYPRLCVYLPDLPESVWFDADFVPFNPSTAGLGLEPIAESVGTKVVAQDGGICVYGSGQVTADGETSEAMTMKEAALLSLILNANGDKVKGCRQTLGQVKSKLGHAGERIQNKKGKGYYLQA